eukprot:s2226_g10.t1
MAALRLAVALLLWHADSALWRAEWFRGSGYPKSYRSSVVALGNFCAYLYLGFDSERDCIVANLVLIAAHPSDSRDSEKAGEKREQRFLDGKARISVRYAAEFQVREKSHRFTFADGAGPWCRTAGCLWTFNAPKDGREEYFPDGELRCVAEFWCDPKAVGYEPNKRRRLDFGRELWQEPCPVFNIGNDMKFTDMMICADDDEQSDLPCHRAILAKRSEEMTEARERKIVIRNASTAALRCLLQYIYTEEIPSALPLQQLGDLICLGNQYGLTALAESCAERLSSMLSAQNVVQVLQVLGRNEGMSLSLGQILEQTTAKVSRDPELMRAIASSPPRITVDPFGRFRGPDGRVQIFHGLNVVQKSFPWLPGTGAFDPFSSLNAEDMANLQSWGFNAIRLGVMWPGVEPVEGHYNQTYLQVVRQLVDDLYSHGIWTIVDFHQDAFTERFCGEGVPDWLLPKLEPIQRTCSGWLPEVAKIFGQCKSFADLNYSTDPKTGFPNTSDCLSIGFDQYSRTPEVVTSWGHFFSYDSIQQKFRGFWRVVASALKDSAGVLGYDLVNEPLNGDYFHQMDLLKPGVADENLLQPLYASVGQVIHSEDPKAILMYEPVPFPDTLPAYLPMAGGVRPVGFTRGPSSNSTQALSYHIYSCGFATDKCNRKGDLPSEDCPICDEMASSAVATREADARRLGGGAFMTEFGACSGTPSCLSEIQRITDRADRALHSWAYWQFKYSHDITTVAGPEEGFYNLNGSLQESKVKALSRT